MISYTQK